jgi:hypothetical protein
MSSGEEIQVRHNGSEQGKSFVATYNRVVQESREAEAAWIADLRERGIKAAHPDDGWVDRENNIVTFCYPQFNSGVTVGDQIALGHHDKHRIVEVVERMPKLMLDIYDTPRFRFAALPTDEPITRRRLLNRILRRKKDTPND